MNVKIFLAASRWDLVDQKIIIAAAAIFVIYWSIRLIKWAINGIKKMGILC